MSSNLDVECISPMRMVGDSQYLDTGSEDLQSQNHKSKHNFSCIIAYLSQFFVVVEVYRTIRPSETQMA